MGFDNFTAFERMVRNKTGWFFFFLLLTNLSGYGQPTTARKYLVLFRDKTGTPYSTARPEQFLSPRAIQRRQRQNIAVQERDLPVTPAYVEQIRQTGATVWFTSRWLNAVLIEATEPTIAAIQRLPFVKGLEFDRPLNNARIAAGRSRTVAVRSKRTTKLGELDTLNYGSSRAQIAQIGVDVMHQRGYHGEGMLIAVLDGGFLNANRVSFLRPLFDENRVVATYDFVDREASVYEDDYHGMSVLSAIAATADNRLYGTAYKASFILLRTEDVFSESRVEEANWLFGAEYADSAGVDVINSSLGYTQFDDPETNYSYEDLNGRTALSTRAAQWASEAGIVVVVSAGNEGSDAWRYISAPADAAGALAIAAVNPTGQRAGFSSFGPSADGRIKPDLAAQGLGTVIGSPGGQVVTGNGTSYAAPLVAGLAAGFWQAHPRLTAAQVTESLRRSGNQSLNPDDQLGYGIPNFARASMLSDTSFAFLLYPNPFSDAERLTVQLSGIDFNSAVEATLADASGRVVWSNRYLPNGPSGFVLPRLSLSAGMYFITLVAGEQKRTLKVIKL